jgi:RNA-directed DNA polymerase
VVVPFDNVDHGWMLKFLQHRIGDRRVLRLIQKWLKAGVSEEGTWSETKVGTPQGAVISPLLANIYLHYVLDLWVHRWRQTRAYGDMILVRYADDFVMGFQHRAEAECFLEALRERLRKFGLELHPEKTRLIEFGRFAASNRKQRGEGKPETFNFLGFTHMCGKTRTRGQYTVRRKSIAKRLRAKLREVKGQLRQRWHEPTAKTGTWLRTVVQGYFNYHAVPGNYGSLETFRREVMRAWHWALKRRSQRARMRWARYGVLADRWLPRPCILHPYPSVRFAVRHPR